MIGQRALTVASLFLLWVLWAVAAHALDGKANAEYEKRRQAVKEEDAEGHYQLALWCEKQKLADLAREEFEEAIGIDPDHKNARGKLGYASKDGRWVSKDHAKYLKAAEGIKLPDEGTMTSIAGSLPKAKAAIDWMKKRDNWADVIQVLHERLGLFYEEMNVKVELSTVDKGGWAAMGGGLKGKGSLSVYLGSWARKASLDDLRRTLIHEMSHVYLSSGVGPSWLTEGLAKFIEPSPDGIMYFVMTKTDPKPIGESYPHYEANYGRGFLFFTWMAQKHGRRAIKKFAQARLDGTGYQEALTKAMGMSWDAAVKAEHEWTTGNWKTIARKYKMPVR